MAACTASIMIIELDFHNFFPTFPTLLRDELKRNLAIVCLTLRVSNTFKRVSRSESCSRTLCTDVWNTLENRGQFIGLPSKGCICVFGSLRINVACLVSLKCGFPSYRRLRVGYFSTWCSTVACGESVIVRSTCSSCRGLGYFGNMVTFLVIFLGETPGT